MGGKRPQFCKGADGGLSLGWGFASPNPVRWTCITPAHCSWEHGGPEARLCRAPGNLLLSCPVAQLNIFSWAPLTSTEDSPPSGALFPWAGFSEIISVSHMDLREGPDPPLSLLQPEPRPAVRIVRMNE